MTLLDRFRTSPQKDPDPTVRLAYLAGLPLTERDQIVAAAREDDDARVRRAAVAKLLDPPALAAIAREDADESVREAALTMLRDIALDAFEGVDEAGSLAAVDVLSDARTLAQVAKTSLREPVARRALAQLAQSGGSHVIASIARQAELEPIRQAAFDRLSDRADFLAVALNCDFKETATAAVDRLSERDDLEQVADRAKNKTASKRARQMLRERDEEAARIAAELQAAEDEKAAEARRAAAADAAAAVVEPVAVVEVAEVIDVIEPVDEAVAVVEVVEDPAALAAAEAAKEAAREDAARDAERRRVADEAQARARRDGLNRMNQLIGRVEALIQKEDLSLKAADRALRDVRAALAGVPPLPSRQDFETISARLKAAQEALAPRVRDLREVSEWQRWANVGIQEQLCEKMEALRAETDPEAIAKRIHELQGQWRLAADVPRPQGETLWKRFKAAHDELWARCESHFATQAAARAENLTKKHALCERAEALAGSSNWVQTAEEIKGLQAEWKAIGAVTRGQEKAIWERFRAACDAFFTRRQDDLAKRKVLWTENFAKKEALCLKVEAIAESTEWDQTSAEIRRLQAEWKTIGPVKKSRSDAIWSRFRAACDKFFARFASRHDIARAERAAAREAICVELEALVPPPAEGDAPQASEAPADLAGTIRGLRNRWQQELAARGVDRDQAAALDRRYADACRAVIARWPAAFAGTDLDPETNRKRMEAIVKRVEDLAASLKGSAGPVDESPTAKLANMLKEALAANTIGGKVDPEARRRAAQDDVRQAQASWSRVGPVSDEVRRELADRFQRAIRQIAGH